MKPMKLLKTIKWERFGNCPSGGTIEVSPNGEATYQGSKPPAEFYVKYPKLRMKTTTNATATNATNECQAILNDIIQSAMR
jgi:hypothetical protein